MSDIDARAAVLRQLRQELIGPDPRGEALDCSVAVAFDEKDKSYGPWTQQDTGDEILLWERPSIRYGLGVLYPRQTPLDDDSSKEPTEEDVPEEQSLEFATERGQRDLASIEKNSSQKGFEADSEDLELSTANTFRPSTMGVSFLCELPSDAKLVVEIPQEVSDLLGARKVNGRYEPMVVDVAGQERTWWIRKPIAFRGEFDAGELTSAPFVHKTCAGEFGDLRLTIEVYSRQYSEPPGARLITVCLVNRSDEERADSHSLFQAYFTAHVATKDQLPCVLPYPLASSAHDEEEESLQLVYRKSRTFAVGHGCAADWLSEDHGTALQVSAESMPCYEAPNITPDIRGDDGSDLRVRMSDLAGLTDAEAGFASLDHLVTQYEHWTDRKEAEIPALDPRYRAAAQRHVQVCRACAGRMREGINLLRSDAEVLQAFRLANHALLLQQSARRETTRAAEFNRSAFSFEFDPPYSAPDPSGSESYWRPFQIAFILMSLGSTAAKTGPCRENVELIWFPTGGGKTEAYLGLAAFSIFLRRLRNPSDAGVDVLMRYTLRLLTTQQFQRASRLICAMEFLRRQEPDRLGDRSISIGIWVGGENTPNTRQDARAKLRALERQMNAENPFVIDRCPWCAAPMGKYQGRYPRGVPRVHGYHEVEGSVSFRCPDSACTFSDALPIVVVDEDIYDSRPDLVIGTVDKFATIAWRPLARSLFGIGPDGSRLCSPPGLIIQDELHLISGPLGSMTGLYETVIEELCTTRSDGEVFRPKIVCSTATIRRYEDQVRALFGRESCSLFPPPGLDSSDTFFGTYQRDASGKLAPGKIYVGVHAPGLGSMQTVQVRTFTSLLQAALGVDPSDRDPWWTLLLFFNSLRELGTTISLFQSDIPDRLRVMRRRWGFAGFEQRRLWRVLELTSRLRSDKIPEILGDLEREYRGREGEAVDVCLATSIIEVGVDVPRLSLMSVVGQPKTTSQYIQATGRIGRKIPGLVVTLYSPTKPRDRSHFEKFRSYHECLYAQVEPTSVTPFASPVLDRALHAILVAYVRQIGGPGPATNPFPVPETLIEQLRPILLTRISSIDPGQLDYATNKLQRLLVEWGARQRTEWGSGVPGDDALLRAAGVYATPEQARQSWATPTSMRNVDAECQAEVTRLYALSGEENDG